MFRIFRFVLEFPPETAEFLKFGNRLLDFLEGRQQVVVNDLAAQLKRAAAEAKAHLERGA